MKHLQIFRQNFLADEAHRDAYIRSGRATEALPVARSQFVRTECPQSRLV